MSSVGKQGRSLNTGGSTFLKQLLRFLAHKAQFLDFIVLEQRNSPDHRSANTQLV